MKLTIREAATLLGRSPRTLRAQVSRGEIPATKRDGRWVVERRHLPLTDSQRQALHARAEQVRSVVDEALPGRLADRPSDRRRSLADLDAFRLGAETLRALQSDSAASAADALPHLHAALLDLAESQAVFTRASKLAAIDRARASVGRAVATLLLDTATLEDTARVEAIQTLENRLLPALHGLARQASRLPGGRS
jgi:excisionase family DNA binding protein